MCVMCVSCRVWGSFLFEVESFIRFLVSNLFGNKITMQMEPPRSTCQGTTFQSRNWFREVVIFVLWEAGGWEVADMLWNAQVPFVGPHHLGQPAQSICKSSASSTNTFLEEISLQKREYGSNQTFVDIHRTSTNALVTSSLENPRSKKLLKSRPRTETKTSTRLFTENVHPTLLKWLKIRKLQREAASEKSGSQWISGESLYDFFAAGRQPWCQKSAPLLSNKTTGSRSLREATYYPFSTVFTEIPGSKGSAILTLQRFVKLFLPFNHSTMPQRCVLCACEVLGGTRAARSTSSCLKRSMGLPRAAESFAEWFKWRKMATKWNRIFFHSASEVITEHERLLQLCSWVPYHCPPKSSTLSWVSVFLGYVWGMPKCQKCHLLKDRSTNRTRARQAWNEGNLNQLVSTIQIPYIWWCMAKLVPPHQRKDPIDALSPHWWKLWRALRRHLLSRACHVASRIQGAMDRRKKCFHKSLWY